MKEGLFSSCKSMLESHHPFIIYCCIAYYKMGRTPHELLATKCLIVLVGIKVSTDALFPIEGEFVMVARSRCRTLV